MGCISRANLCPASGDTENVLLQKILQSLIEGGGGGSGGGVTGISVNGGPLLTGNVSIATGSGVQSVNGDAGPIVSLDSGEVPEGANLYFTNARAIASTLTGFVSGAGTITAASTVLQALQILDFRTDTGGFGPFVLKAGDTMTGSLLFSTPANVTPLQLTSYSLAGAGAIPAIFISGTWNTSGTPTALYQDIVDTASNANSLLFNFLKNAVSVASLRKDGLFTLAGQQVINRGSIAASSPSLTINETWDGLATFTALSLNVTDNSSLSGSLLANLQLGGATRFKVQKDGVTTITSTPGSGNTLLLTSTYGTTTVARLTEGLSIDTSLLLPNGSGAAPALAFSADTNTGLFQTGVADTLGVSTGGVVRLTLNTASLTSTLPFLGPAGSVGAPAFSFALDPNTGFYNLTTDVLAVAAGGTSIGAFLSTGLILTSTSALGWVASTNPAGSIEVALRRDAAGILALSNGVNAQTFRITETTDAGLTNYSRLSLQTQAGNHLIRTEAAGTGTLRILQVGTGPSTGSNIAGINSIFHGGQSTGSAAGGSILFQVSPAGGAGAGVNALVTGASVTSAGIFATLSSIYSGGNVHTINTYWIGSTVGGTQFGGITSISNGILRLINSAATDFTRLQFGGTTSAFPALERNGTILEILAADGASNANLSIYNVKTNATSYERLDLTWVANEAFIRTTRGINGGTIRVLFVGSGPNFGTNQNGTNTIIHAGQSTGNQLGGTISFQSSAAGASGTTTNALVTYMSINPALVLVSTSLTTQNTRQLVGFTHTVQTGTDQRAGNATLVAGTVTVSNTTVTTGTIVLLTRKTSGGTIGFAITYTVSAGASFTITSDNVLDTSTFSYYLIEAVA